jgi:SAM-dependent methyltransferase
VASAYTRLAAPSQFVLPPARDLVGLLDVPVGAMVLDVGSGTGVVAAALARMIGAAGRVIAADPLVAMLFAAGLGRPFTRSWRECLVCHFRRLCLPETSNGLPNHRRYSISRRLRTNLGCCMMTIK